jgi:hypothetical protein
MCRGAGGEVHISKCHQKGTARGPAFFVASRNCDQRAFLISRRPTSLLITPLLIMDQIEIFLILDDEVQIPLLSIPHSDIERLAFSPFRWICYVMFTICGSEGDLFETPDPNCPAVDYDRTEFPKNTYYYRPSRKPSFCV